MTILLATDFAADKLAGWRRLLEEALPEETLVTTPGAADIDIALVANPPPGALAGLPGLRLIQSMWAGVDKLLADPTVPAGVPLARMVDPAMSEAMAQTALWAVLGLHRGYFDYARQQQARQWRVLPQRRADEVHVAVLGMGAMGRACARRLAALGYRVSGWATRPTAAEGIAVQAGDAALDALLAAADVVIDLLPLTPATQGFFDRARFARMRRGAGLVNLARGAHVVEADLIEALDQGQLQRAVLDVFATEPLPADHPLWAHPRVTVLPHAAAQTDLRTATQVAAENVRALRAGRPLAHLVARARGY